MKEIHTYNIPQGVAHTLFKKAYDEDIRDVRGPGEYEFDICCDPHSVLLTWPHLESITAHFRDVQNAGSITPTEIMCIYHFTQEIVDPERYSNCHTLVFNAHTKEKEMSIDGETYIEDMCDQMIFQKFSTLTFEDAVALINTEIDISAEPYFDDYQKQLLNYAGTKITQLKVLLLGVKKAKGGI